MESDRKYWIDWLGQLWMGPGNPEDNLYYARFHGFMEVPPFKTIWVWERTDPPVDADEVSRTAAATAASMFWDVDLSPTVQRVFP